MILITSLYRTLDTNIMVSLETLKKGYKHVLLRSLIEATVYGFIVGFYCFIEQRHRLSGYFFSSKQTSLPLKPFSWRCLKISPYKVFL